MISVQSSGSIVSAIAVEPLTSLNSIVTTRRSPSIARPARAASSLASSSRGRNGSSGASALASSWVPQALQYREPSGFAVPQAGQFMRSPTPLERDAIRQELVSAQHHHVVVVATRMVANSHASVFARGPAESRVERDGVVATEEHAELEARGRDVLGRSP